MPKHVWTKAQTDLLRVMWEQGYQGSEIAEALGHQYSRNAVLTKANRMKLPGRFSVATARMHVAFVA